jgi:hypothetical protein
MPRLLTVQLGMFRISSIDARVTMYVSCIKAIDMHNLV